jgi:hypothetical protein
MPGIKTESPFTPGRPAPVELFVGRQAQLAECQRYLRQAVAGHFESIFLAAERGLGKTSYARYLLDYAAREEGLLAVHVSLAGVTTVPDLVRHALERVLNEARREDWFERLRVFFGRHVRKAEAFGLRLEFAPPADELACLAAQFPQTLGNLALQIAEHKTGLLLVLDDLDGLAGSAEFAHWYKGLVDGGSVQFPRLPAALMLVGLPAQRAGLYALQPSLPRVFRHLDIAALADDDVATFFTRTFATAGVGVGPDALEVMTSAARGLPMVMQEVGDAVHWLDRDDHVDLADARAGVLRAADNIGRKYLDPRVAAAITGPRYQAILRPLAREVAAGFSRAQLTAHLPETERGLGDNFLRRMREFGVIELDRESGIGAYRFTNPLYPVFMALRVVGGD